MAFGELIREMAAAACRGDGAGVAACFTRDGVYHDVFYGAHRGPEIVGMIEGCFHRDGARFLWDIHDPVEANGIGYARYVFSFDSRQPGHEGNRAIFEGVAICHLQDGLIREYREVAEAVAGLARIGFPEARIAKYAERQASALWARDEAGAHVSGPAA